MQAKEKIFFAFICDPTILKFSSKKTNSGEHGLMLLPPLHRAFDFFRIHLKSPKIEELSIDQFCD